MSEEADKAVTLVQQLVDNALDEFDRQLRAKHAYFESLDPDQQWELVMKYWTEFYHGKNES